MSQFHNCRDNESPSDEGEGLPPVDVPVKDYYAQCREYSVHDTLTVAADIVFGGEGTEEDILRLWNECFDSLFKMGYFERDGAKLIKAGLVPPMVLSED